MKRFFPVVHCAHEGTTQESIAVARKAGADGIFLINQGSMTTRLIGEVARSTAQVDPKFRVGLNLLGKSADWIADEVDGSAISMWWADNGLSDKNLRAVDVPGFFPSPSSVRTRSAADVLRDIEFFGGVAFKYQKEVPDDRLGAEIERSRGAQVNVVTTSGPGTGHPPNIEKIQIMADHIKRFNSEAFTQTLAVASGITVENVGLFLPYVDSFIVGTAIEARFGVLDLAKTRALADRIHEGA